MLSDLRFSEDNVRVRRDLLVKFVVNLIEGSMGYVGGNGYLVLLNVV
uniref:Uncharacterized protein n=1 Tax=Anguilla anguilla TaxID=7936 RepID=A0A0E9TYP2_ANGAN